MDHRIETQLHGQIELDAECLGLTVFPCGEPRAFQSLGEMMVIDAGLPDRHDLGMAGQFPQGGEKLQPLLLDIGRMDSDHGKNTE